MHLSALCRGHYRDEQADGAGPQHEQPLPGLQTGSPDRTQGVAAGFDEGAECRVDGAGQGLQGFHGDG